MALLLKHQEDKTNITDEAVSIIAENFDGGVMALRLDRQGGEVTITAEMVKVAPSSSGNGKKVMTLLLSRRGGEITITDEAVKAAARNAGDGKADRSKKRTARTLIRQH